MESGRPSSRYRKIMGRIVIKLSKERLAIEAEATGFRAEVLEKVIHLPCLLEGFRSHPLFKKRLVKECRDRLFVVLPFTYSETEFLNLLLDRGEMVPSLLTFEKDLQERISRHPLLEWKVLNVRQYRGK